MEKFVHFLADDLKERRVSHNIGFAEIEKDIGIRKEYIEALESRSFDKLPADIYLIPIVRSYAKYLGLDERAVLQKFKQEKEDHAKSKTLDLSPDAQILSHSSPITGKNIFLGTATAVLALVVFYVVQQFYHVSSPPDLVIFEPASGINISNNNILVKGRTNNSSKIEFNGKVISTDNNGNFSIPVDLKNGENTISIVATSNNGQKHGENLLVYADLPTSTSTPLAGHLSRDALTLSISANDTSWVSIKTDGESIQKTMRAGDEEAFTGKTIELIAGNAGALAIALNGSNPTILGEQGEVIKKRYSWDDTNISYLNK
ncbi:MAG: hypothetical protein A2V81_01730 [Candidatus Abawacabacteria bacterium RBG_16_42_10]|uniref:Cytoskeleton protein RodZ-like C-terminal domain-containing protein n=1 Tax=Candidatus Abawacabacteria bacterium RBG_16_42_10 TaxID=1817814 RepID=A0A1F4XJE6_9BACT|nr:MAG: hypothetical protein A2V81_01730 [Candidatus Abawacabacteria bacterium RBG_16_42_10]